MKIREFGVEIWMNKYETQCALNLAETCVESLTIAELLEMAGKTGTILAELLPLKMTYGAIEGSERLRSAIASLYAGQKIHNITVTHGAIGANALVHETLVEPGDRVISVLPTYQQHYSIPASYGADVQILKLREENGFLPDLDELRRLALPGTKLIAINNPNNPTGSLMDEAFLRAVAKIAEDCGAWVLCDEVYRGTDQTGDGFTTSIADLYGKGISTGSMSKTYSLAGLRLGWIAAPVELIQAVSIHRDYNTISVGMLDDHFAALALENRAKVLARSQKITRGNLAILDSWVAAEPRISYVKPQSGTTALLKYEADLSSEDFCVRLLKETGVMLTPGSAMDMEGYLRIGYANNPEVLTAGLARMSEFLAKLPAQAAA
ncbi:aminotransferase [Dongia sp.]|uniref:aminotransferase n=1 Tax=Dongia sp. TaxID=1977262 RepID=UPI0035AEEA06